MCVWGVCAHSPRTVAWCKAKNPFTFTGANGQTALTKAHVGTWVKLWREGGMPAIRDKYKTAEVIVSAAQLNKERRNGGGRKFINARKLLRKHAGGR